MEKVTIIINDAPYGTEKAWNALRYAGALLVSKVKVNIFLLGDSVGVVKRGQITPKGYYNLEAMVKDLVSRGVIIKACGTCCKARGLSQADMIEGVEIGRMVDLTRWTCESDGMVSF